MNHSRLAWAAIVSGVVLLVVGAWLAMVPVKPPDSTPTLTTPVIPTHTSTAAPTSAPSATPTPTSTATPTPTSTATPTPVPLSFDGDQAYLRVLEQCDFGARPTGSDSNRLVGDYVIAMVKELGWSASVQEFTYRGVPGRNIVARKGRGPLVILGAHYDTRPFADRDPPETQDQHIVGANDGGSGVAVLLELARVLDMDRVPYEVRLLFFDAEDRGRLDGWPYAVGAEEYAKAIDRAPKYVIVVDMVGDDDQAFYWDGNSDPELNAQIWDLAARLGYDQVFIPEVRWNMIDDHLPFVQRGWKAIDIIDFEYPYWHTTQDTVDKVSAESLGRIGHVLEVFLETATE